MGVYLNMNIGKKTFNLGRSHKYIDCRDSVLDINLENLYNKKMYATDMVEKRIIAMAAHHPTKEELAELVDEIEDMMTGYADEIELISRCMVLAEIKDNDVKVEFEVK